MAKLFLHPDPRVSAVAVRGEMIVDASNRDVIMTRSKARAGELSRFPPFYQGKEQELALIYSAAKVYPDPIPRQGAQIAFEGLASSGREEG